MSKLIRRKKEIGAALIVALQLITVTLVGLMLPYAGGPQQSANAPADAQMSAAPQARPVSAPPSGAIRATKLYEPRASQVFDLAVSRADSAQQAAQHGAQQSMQEGETPNEATLTTDLEDYPPFSYVYISGTGFEPGETVNMIVVQLDPNPAAYEPWDVVADENGNIATSWYIFSEEFVGATMQVTATGLTSGLTASATFTDAAAPTLHQDSARTIKRDAFAWGDTVYLKANFSGQGVNRCYKVEWVNPSATVVQTTNYEAGTIDTLASFVVPSGPSGVWTVRLYEATANGACSGATFPGSPTATANFDVARAVIIGASATGGVGGDNWVREQQPGTIQSGDLDVDSKSGNQNRRSFLRFDLTGAGISGTVDSGKLRMRLSAAPNNSRTHGAHRVTATWVESGIGGITWNNQPAFNVSATNSQLSGTTNNVLVRWTLTSDVQGFVDSSFVNYGWCVKDATESSSGNNTTTYKATDSNTVTDKTQGPVLLVDYSAASPTPTSTPTSTPTATATATATPTATATFTPTPTPTPTCNPASVTLNPISQTVTYGTASVIFTASATGTPAPTVQWQVNTGSGFADIGGATSTTLTINNPTVAMSGFQYRAVFTSSCPPGTATSSAATLTVNQAQLEITANSFSKQYGLTYSFTNTEYTISNGTLYNGDTISSVALSSAGATNTATVTAPGPTYAIVPGPGVTFSVGSAGNYNIAFVNGTLTVTQAPLQLTANSFSKQYGLTYNFTGAEYSISNGILYNGDTISSVALSSAGAADTATVVAPGPTYTIVAGSGVTFSVGAAGNYSIAFVNGTLTVSQAQLEITADSFSKQYGLTHTFTGTEYTFTSGTTLYNGDTISSVALSSAGATNTATFVAPGPIYTITAGPGVTFSVGAAGNYNISLVDGTLTVTQAPLEITANSFSKQYGMTHTFTGTEYTFTSGTTLYNGDTISSVALSSAGAANTATVTAPGPTYTITAGPGVTFSVGVAGNYNISFVNGTLTVTQAPLEITANSFSKQYGLTYNFTGAEYTISNGTLYNGDMVSSVALSSAGATNTATVTAPGPTYAIVPGPGVTFSVGAAGNYNIAFVNGTLTVTQAPLQLTANSFSKQYGLTYNFSGAEYSITNGMLYNGDTISSVALSSTGAAGTATVVAPGPTYTIVAGPGVTFSVGAAGNYSIAFVNGTLTVTQAPLQLTANSFSKQYGLTYSFTDTEYTISTGTLYNGDTISSVALSSTGAAGTATVVAPGPTYTITAGPGVTFSVGAAGNYNIAFVNGILTVTQAPLTITATNRSKVFGATYTPDTTPTSVDFTITGTLYNGDSVTSITLTCAGYPAAALPQPTPYTVTPSAAVGTGLGNYNIGYVNGQFTIGYGTCTGPNASGVILQPIDADGSSIFPRAGRTVPVKFTVCDANGNPISDPNAVFAGTGGALTMLSAVRGQVPNPDESAFNDIPDVAFRWASDKWIFNMATSNLQQNTTYTFRINLANGQGITFVIKIK